MKIKYQEANSLIHTRLVADTFPLGSLDISFLREDRK